MAKKKNSMIVIIMIGLVIFFVWNASKKEFLKEGSTTLQLTNILADATVSSGTATLGADTFLQIGAGCSKPYRTYITIDTSAIPAGNKINSARLALYYYYVGTGAPITLSVYGVNKDWVESTIVQSNQPCALDIATSTDCGTTPLSSVEVPATAGWYYLDITNELSAKQQAGAKTISLVVTAAGSSCSVRWAYSKESTQVQKPYIDVTYSPNAGLVAYLPLEKDTLDASYNGYDATPSANMVLTTVTGPTHSAYSLSSSDAAYSYLNFAKPISLPISEGLTVSFWLKPTLRTPPNTILGNSLATNPKLQYTFNAYGNALQLNLDGGVTSSSMLLEGWHYYALSTLNGQTSWYRDGEFVSSDTYTTTATTFTFDRIGSMVGAIDELRVFNYPLTSTEIKADYDLSAPYTYSKFTLSKSAFLSGGDSFLNFITNANKWVAG